MVRKVATLTEKGPRVLLIQKMIAEGMATH